MKFNAISFYILIFIVLSAPVKAQDWTLIDTSVTHTGTDLRSAFFTNDSTGIVVGGDGFGTGVILKTTNAGLTWSLRHVAHNLYSVYFPSKDTGYASGEHATVMKTIDGGNTWSNQNTSVISPAYLANSVCFLNNDVGFVGVRNGPGYAFLKTHNGGITWVNDITDTVQSDFFCKINDSTLYGMYGILSKTTNSGNSWTKSSILPSGGWGTSLCFLNDSVGFATLDHGSGTPCYNYSSLIKTTDGGQTWNEINYNCDFEGPITFPSMRIGYMLGAGGGVISISKTKDGGNTWNSSPLPLDASKPADFIICTDTNTCYVLTGSGYILKTTNGAGNVGISEIKINNEILNIYPNPAINQISVEFDLTETINTSVEIKNILGQTVKTISNTIFSKGTNKIEIDISDLSKGLYVVHLQNENKFATQKFIKQ